MTTPFRRPARAGVRPSPVFLGILIATVLSGYYLWSSHTLDRGVQFGVFLFVILGWLVTLSLHEFAHAFLAWRFGDHEVEARGYLTLNPLKYAHPVLSIGLPLLFIAIGGFGMPGGAVYLHPQQFRTKKQRAAVSLSGPLMNVLFAVVLLAVVKSQISDEHLYFWYALAFLAALQVMASVLNLIPFPGLDGYGALEPYLDPQFQRAAEQFKPFGMLGLFVILQVPTLNRAFFDFVYWLYGLSGLPRYLADNGYALLQFWHSVS
ncbi:MAG: site-2 protease family protein [Frankiales bacterium]|jgi:Zn-dependent protease|nr:site-2 protease family protein [Frankiales bacterium]